MGMAFGQTVLQYDSSTVAHYMHLAGLKPLQSFDYRHGDTTMYTVRVSAIVPGEHPLFVRVDFNFNTEIVTWQRGRALCWQNDERGILDEGRYLLSCAEGSSLSHMYDYAVSPRVEGSHGGLLYVLEINDYVTYGESFDGPSGYYVKTLLSLADSARSAGVPPADSLLIYHPDGRCNVSPASFPGGEKACDAFIDSMRVYPPEALREFRNETVNLEFIVERDGTVSRLRYKQQQEDEYGFHAEAERLLGLMPRWQPALKEGKPVRSTADCAFRFRVPDSLKPAYGHPIRETQRDSSTWSAIYGWYLKHYLHPDDFNPCYYMAANYYDEFMLPLVPVKVPDAMDSFMLDFRDFSYNYDRTPVVASPADSALKYFYLFLDRYPGTESTYGYNDTLGKLLDVYIPIRQLERHLGLPHDPRNRLPFDTVAGVHYPHSVFCDPDDDALPATYSRIDNFDLSDSYFWVQALSRDLKRMSEPVLYDTLLAPGDTVLRFAFYPSFHAPLSFRIEKHGAPASRRQDIILYWKMLDFEVVEKDTVDENGWNFETILHPREGQCRLSPRKYRRLMQFFEPLHFDSLPRTHYQFMTDGATWTIERRTADTFKIHLTNLAGDKIGDLYDYLIKLAHLKAKYARGYCRKWIEN